MTTLNIEKVALQDRLGGVLGRSWDVFGAVLGLKNIEKPLVLQAFREKSLFDKKRVPRAVLDRSWANLGPQKGQNGTQNGTQNGPKNHQNFEAILEAQKAPKRNLS